jgi:uncharacterized protein (TIGR01777 family)
MIGSWLARVLRDRGDEVLIVTRGRPRRADHVQWDPLKRVHDVDRLDGLDAVVNLTGAPIADRPWTRQRRKELWESRVEATNTLLDALASRTRPPKVLVGAGGLGYFGDRGDVVLDEGMAPGSGFLAELSQAWEQAQLDAVKRLGARAAVLRMSIVLSPTGGAFPLMVKPFRVGLGGWLGNGRQYTSWISIRDTVGAFQHLLDHPGAQGPFNGTIPDPTPNKEWLKALGHVLHRPVITHAPKWALRGAFGELAEDLFLASVRAIPRKLVEQGYVFQDPTAESTFPWLLSELRERRRPGANPERRDRPVGSR